MLSTAEASRSHCKTKLSTMTPSVNSSIGEGTEVAGHTQVSSVAMGNQDHSVHVGENGQRSISEERPSGSSAIVEVKLSHPVSSGTGGEMPAEEGPSCGRPLVREEGPSCGRPLVREQGEQALLGDTRGRRLDSKSVTFDRNTARATSLSSFSTSNTTGTAFRGEDRLKEPLSLPKPANEGDVPITITTSETALDEEEPSEEPKEETSEEPKEEISEEPKEEPSEELKDEPSEELKDEPSEEPKEKTSEEPKEETSEDPKEETSEECKGETSEEPKGETSEEPQKETSVSVNKSGHHSAHSNKHYDHIQHGLSSASEWSLKPLPRPSPLSPLASHSVPLLDQVGREPHSHAFTSDSKKPPKASKSGKSKKNRKKTPTSELSTWDAIHLSAGAREESVNPSLSHLDSSKTKFECVDSLKRPQHTKEDKQTVISSEQTYINSDQTAINSEKTTISSEQTAISSEQTAINSEQTAISSEQTAINSEQTTSSMHLNHSVERSTVPPHTTMMEDSIIDGSLPLGDVYRPPPITIPENLKVNYFVWENPTIT